MRPGRSFAVSSLLDQIITTRNSDASTITIHGSSSVSMILSRAIFYRLQLVEIDRMLLKVDSIREPAYSHKIDGEFAARSDSYLHAFLFKSFALPLCPVSSWASRRYFTS